jgi:hypothetical protein
LKGAAVLYAVCLQDMLPRLPSEGCTYWLGRQAFFTEKIGEQALSSSSDMLTIALKYRDFGPPPLWGRVNWRETKAAWRDSSRLQPPPGSAGYPPSADRGREGDAAAASVQPPAVAT